MRLGMSGRPKATAAPSRRAEWEVQATRQNRGQRKLLLCSGIELARLLSYPALVSFITHCSDESAHNGQEFRESPAIHFLCFIAAAGAELLEPCRRQSEDRSS